jgi:DNA-binding LytR/AlgR family response regulator
MACLPAKKLSKMSFLHFSTKNALSEHIFGDGGVVCLSLYHQVVAKVYTAHLPIKASLNPNTDSYMANVLIAENKSVFVDTLKPFIDQKGHTIIDVKDNAEEFLHTTMSTKPDILLMEIALEGSMNGIEVAKRLRDSGLHIPIIFITNLQETSLFERAKQVNAFAYIVKPFIEEDLHRTIELSLQVYRHFTNQMEIQPEAKHKFVLSNNNFFVKSGDKLEKVCIDEIAYISIEDRYLNVYTSARKYVLRITLKEFMTRLPADIFAQVHRDYVINLNHIQYINAKDSEVCVLGKYIPVSKRHKDYLMEHLNILS